jgi:hypothetical protein
MKKFRIDFILAFVAFICASFYYIIRRSKKYYNFDDLIIENNTVLNPEAIKFGKLNWIQNFPNIIILTIIIYLFFKINHHFVWKKNFTLTKKIILSLIFAFSIIFILYALAFILFVFMMKGTS